jgi:hypothetical protein
MVWRQHWDFQLYKALEYQYMQVHRVEGEGVMGGRAAKEHVAGGHHQAQHNSTLRRL